MLLRGSEKSQERTLTIVGSAVLVCVIVAAFVIVTRPFAGRSSDRIAVAIDTTYIGQGVREGTPIVMHGVEVGVVKELSNLPAGGVRLLTDLQKRPVAGLTDTMTIEYRPVNYFGVTGINVVAGTGGRELRDGVRIDLVPRANSTLQAMLSRLNEVSISALNTQLISVIDRAEQYTDGLSPLIETLVNSLRAVADVQKVSTARLLANATGISVAFPTFTDGAVYAGDRLVASKFGELSEETFKGPVEEIVKLGTVDLFGAFGRILGNNVDTLLPAVDEVKSLTDPVPALFRPAEFSNTLVQLRTRFEHLFAGNDQQRALQVRIVLDKLPGVEAPLGMGAGQ